MLTASLPNRNAVHQRCGKLIRLLPLLICFFPAGSGMAGVQLDWKTDANPLPPTSEFSPGKKANPDRDQILLDASLIASLIGETSNRNSVEGLRNLQRAFRVTGPSPTGGNSLQEILRISDALRLQDEFIRYARMGSHCQLSDEKITLKAAIQLTESRHYSDAAIYYQKWLELRSPAPDEYLRTLVSMETGRLHYLARQYAEAEIMFQKVVQNLQSPSLLPEQKKQLLRNSEITFRMMASTFLKTGNSELAKKLVDQLNVDPLSPVQFLVEAQSDLGKGKTESAKNWVMRFVAKQPNNSEAYMLLRKIIARQHDGQPRIIERNFISELESIRQKFQTGKVLDDLLVDHYLKNSEINKAKIVLRRQRSDSLWRDEANRLLVKVALLQKDFHSFLNALTIEVNEHQSLESVRSTLLANQELIQEWSLRVLGELAQNPSVPARICCFCLLNLSPVSEKKVLQELDSVVTKLLTDIVSHPETSLRRKLQQLTLLGLEAEKQKKFRQALLFFEKSIELNQASTKSWVDQKLALDALLALTFCYGRLDQRTPAFDRLQTAESIVRYTPAQMHLKAETHLQFSEFPEAVVEYTKLLGKYDGSGASQRLIQLLEQARIELAFTFFLMDEKILAKEILNEAWDRNPFGPDLDRFGSRIQKYTKEKLMFLEFANGVKHGGALPLGRN